MRRFLVGLGVACVFLGALSGVASAQPASEFRLGFKALADQIPAVVGQPLENEHWGDNGDSLQRTTTGLMAWRKADNWTAFTNGSRTWVNGPFGVMERGNAERFAWEAAADQPPSAELVKGVAARLRPGQTLANSPIPILLPPSGIDIFEGLQARSATITSSGYEITLEDDLSGTAELSAARGRNLAQNPPECAQSDIYCPYTRTPSGTPISELFRDLRVGGLYAEVDHGACCNGDHWTVYWYDPAVDATYSLFIYRGPADKLGAPGVNPEHLTAATRLAAIAARLAPTPSPPNVTYTNPHVVQGADYYSDTVFVMGELRNEGSAPAYNVRVSGRLLSVSGSVSGADDDEVSYIGPGDTVAYSLVVKSPSPYVRAEVVVSARAQPSLYHYMKANVSNTGLRKTTDHFRLAGIVTNGNDVPLSSTAVRAWFLDGQNNVVNVYSNNVLGDLAPGASVNFDQESTDGRYNPEIARITQGKAYAWGYR